MYVFLNIDLFPPSVFKFYLLVYYNWVRKYTEVYVSNI